MEFEKLESMMEALMESDLEKTMEAMMAMIPSYVTMVKKFQHIGKTMVMKTAQMVRMKMTEGAHSLVITVKKFQLIGKMMVRKTVLMDLMRMLAQWSNQGNLKN
jgi:hypothetical protein